MNEDVEFLDKFAKKREDFFKQMKPDEEFLAQKEQRHREKQRENISSTSKNQLHWTFRLCLLRGLIPT